MENLRRQTVNVSYCEQGTEEWKRIRIGRPTASQFSRILTPTGKPSDSQSDYAFELIADCYRPDMSEFGGNKHTQRGVELEPEARLCFERETGLQVEQVGFVGTHDWRAGCSPDGLIRDEDGRYIAGLEIKCPLAKNHIAYSIGGKLPSQYKAQVHGSMAVTGLRNWYFMSFCPPFKPFIISVVWDSYTDMMQAELNNFIKYLDQVRAEVLPVIT